MGKVIERPFFNHELERIERKLLSDFEREEPTEYEVWVDGLKVIDRTDDPDQFGTVSNHISLRSTEEVEIILFRGRSQHSDKMTLLLEQNQPKKSVGATLDGITEDYSKRLKHERLEWDHQALQEKYNALETDHQELKAHSKQIEEELAQLKDKKLHLGNVNLAELSGVWLEGFIRRNPQMLTRFPGGDALAGIIVEDNQAKAAGVDSSAEPTTPSQGTASFSPAGASTDNPEDQPYIELLKRIRDSFSEQDFLQVMVILDGFITRPDLIPTVKDLLEGEPEPTISTEQF